MSYLFGNTGGTTWGLKTYNQIFALDSNEEESANYWNKSGVKNYDTVICSTNSRLLTAYYKNGDPSNTLYWYGTGIYLCTNKYSSTINPGDYVLAYYTSTPPAGNFPFVTLGTSNLDRAVGVALTSGASDGDVLIATSGDWPVKRRETMNFNDHVRVSNDAADIGTVESESGGGIGNVGKLKTADFDIIVNTGGDVVNGCICTFWGTSAEIN